MHLQKEENGVITLGAFAGLKMVVREVGRIWWWRATSKLRRIFVCAILGRHRFALHQELKLLIPGRRLGPLTYCVSCGSVGVTK